jgi:hypothetical protein
LNDFFLFGGALMGTDGQNVMERIEAAGLSEALDTPLRAALARMTFLLEEDEKKAA